MGQGVVVPDPTPAAAASPLRVLEADDAHRLLDLIVACDVADDGEPDYTLEDVEDDLRRRGWRGWGIEGDDGRLLAYGWVEKRDNQASVHGDVRVHPEADAGFAQPLLQQVRAEAARLDPGGGLMVPVSANSHRARGWLAAAGGTVVRHFWRMVIDLESDVDASRLPDGVTIEQPGDDVDQLRTVHRVIDTAFLDHFGSVPSDFETWLERQRSSPGADLGLWWLVRVADVPAAALIARMWPDTGWVQGLGTLEEFRGRGLARLLLLTAFAEFRRRGQPKVSLGVDAASPTGALALYESVGMRRALEVLMVELPALPVTP